MEENLNANETRIPVSKTLIFRKANKDLTSARLEYKADEDDDDNFE